MLYMKRKEEPGLYRAGDMLYLSPSLQPATSGGGRRRRGSGDTVAWLSCPWAWLAVAAANGSALTIYVRGDTCPVAPASR